jgi:NAD+ kinase
MSHFKKIGIYAKNRTSSVISAIKKLEKSLESLGCNIFFEKTSGLQLGIKRDTFLEIDSFCDEIDLCIVVGGDGSMLSACRRIAHANVPLLGVNLGRLGFLTDISPSEIDNLILPVLSGNYKSTTRFLLEVSVQRQSIQIGNEIAVNDIALHPGMAVKMMSFELNVDGEFVYSQSSDGLIVASPTGSTAYALSAGGPLVYPTLNAIVVVPMNPHTLSSRPIVLESSSVLQIIVSDVNKLNPVITCDGQTDLSTHPGDLITISRHKNEVTLIHPKDINFYDACRSKLGWGNKLSK